MTDCPDPSVHGNPFRYCPYCEWRETDPAADLDRVRRSVNPEAYWRERAEVAEAGLAALRRDVSDAAVDFDDYRWAARDIDPYRSGYSAASSAAAERLRALLAQPGRDTPPPAEDPTCSCGSPAAYSLAADETVVHRQDGPCYFAPAPTTGPGADKGDRDLNDKLANSCHESTATAALTATERAKGRRAGSLPSNQIVYDLTTVERILAVRAAGAEGGGRG